MSDERRASGTALLFAFLAGAVAGAAVALLTAPKNGREMRDAVGSWVRRSGARDALERAADAVRAALHDRPSV
jgi:gas vesicle protein